MEPAAHVFLSYFDWATVLFVVALAGWTFKYLIHLLTKAKAERMEAQRAADDERAKRFLQQQESLESTVRELIGVVGELKAWVAMEFVRQEEHRRDIDRLRDDIADHAARFQRDLDAHRDECPVRRA